MGTVAVRLSGGLGNQLTQYAAALRTLREAGESFLPKQDLILDARGFHNPQERAFELEVFGPLAASILRSPTFARKRGSVLWRTRKLWPPVAVNRLLAYEISVGGLRALDGFCTVSEGGPITALSQNNVYLQGNFQHRQYLVDPDTLIRSLTGWRLPESRVQRIAVHVRRGDYLHPQHTHTHGALTRDYFLRARELVGTELGRNLPATFYTEDAAYVASELALAGDEIIAGSAKNGIADFVSMSAFRAVVTSNSTYSYWSACLGKAPVVATPRRWFRTASATGLGMAQPGWIVLDNELH